MERTVLKASAAESFGIIERGPRVRSKRLQNSVTVLFPTLAATIGIASGIPLTLTSAALFTVFFVAGGVGAGIGLHRYFSHHAFSTSDRGRMLLGILSSWAWQGNIEQWVADHRRHHRFADTPLDPHSPHWFGHRPARRLTGLLHAHLGWMLYGDVSDPSKFAADIGNDRVSRLCTRAYWPLALSTLALPAAAGLALGGVAEMASCLVWAGLVRVATIQHFTWAIASAGHSFGSKVPESKDEARDNLILSVLMFGEGLHSFHHANPGVGINQPESLDMNGNILSVMERFGWISELRRIG